MEMSKKLTLACLLAVPSLASAASGAYLVAGGASGSVDLKDIEQSYLAPHTTDDDVTRALIGVGARVNPFLAVEGVYMTESDNTVESRAVGDRDTFEHSGLQLSVLGLAPITPQFGLFGRLSANVLNTNYMYEDTNLGVTVFKDDQTGAHLGFGFGANLQVNDVVGLRLQWERIMMQDLTIIGATGFPERANIDVDQTSVALTFNF
jgi:hypothetical protein